MRRAVQFVVTAFVALLSLAALAADPVSPPKRRNLDTTMMPAADDGDDSVVHTFGAGGEAQCSTKANTACGSCSMTCPVGKAAVCLVGVPSPESAMNAAGPKCVRPPSCTCK